MSVASVSPVRATKARETADFEVERDLALTLGRAHARTADRHAAGPEGDRARLVAVADGAAAGVVLALRADDLLDLGLHQLVEDAGPDAHRQRHESLLGRSGQLSKRLLHPLGQLLAGVLGGRDLSGRYGPHRRFLLVSLDLVALVKLSREPDEAGGPPPSSSTDYGTCS
jgi:hypothetical protein